MSLKVVYTDGATQHGPYELASQDAWEDFARWVESLPKTYWALKTFVMRGEWDGTDELSKELRAGMADWPPERMGAEDTVRCLQSTLGVGASDEGVMVIGSLKEAI